MKLQDLKDKILKEDSAVEIDVQKFARQIKQNPKIADAVKNLLKHPDAFKY